MITADFSFRGVTWRWIAIISRSKGVSGCRAVVEKAFVQTAGGQVVGPKGQSDESAVWRQFRRMLNRVSFSIGSVALNLNLKRPIESMPATSAIGVTSQNFDTHRKKTHDSETQKHTILKKWQLEFRTRKALRAALLYLSRSQQTLR